VAAGPNKESLMSRRLIGWFVLIPLCALLVVFALANRHAVVVNFNPLAAADLSAPGAGMPLFLVIYAALFFGIALGGVAVWWSQGIFRREMKHFRKKSERLEAELDTYRRQSAAAADPAIAAADELGRG